jgi:hypothetical protein
MCDEARDGHRWNSNPATYSARYQFVSPAGEGGMKRCIEYARQAIFM